MCVSSLISFTVSTSLLLMTVIWSSIGRHSVYWNQCPLLTIQIWSNLVTFVVNKYIHTLYISIVFYSWIRLTPVSMWLHPCHLPAVFAQVSSALHVKYKGISVTSRELTLTMVRDGSCFQRVSFSSNNVWIRCFVFNLATYWCWITKYSQYSQDQTFISVSVFNIFSTGSHHTSPPWFLKH